MRRLLPLLLGLPLLACAADTSGDETAPAGDEADALTSGMPPAQCDAAHPVKLVVSLTGQDGDSVHGLVGIDLVDAHGVAVDRDGGPNPHRATYPIVLGFNPSYDAQGKPHGTPGEVRTWTGCVAGNVARAYLEAYPKDATGKTDRSKYGETVYQYVAVHGPGAYPVGLRFPVVNGGTGGIFGHVTCNGVPTVPDHPHLRVWSAEPGDACGIRAFSASADASNDPSYKFSALAGGQCWGPSQPVNAYIRGNCGGRYREVVKRVDVVTGRTIPVNVDLATGRDTGPAH